MSLTRDIKEFGLEIGYSKVGITTADVFSEYKERLKVRGDSYDWFLRNPDALDVRINPRAAAPEAKSIIVLILDYCQTHVPEVFQGKVSRLYTSGSYMSPKNRLAGARYQLFLDFLLKNKVQVFSEVIVPDRMAAARAGVTTYGKNNFAFLKGIGSFIHTKSLVIDAELEYDAPTQTVNCPPNCTACIDACPTKALFAPLTLNPRKCIAFNTFSTQDRFAPEITSYIPPDIRAKMGQLIHGCDICQEVCPRNQSRFKAKLPPNAFLEVIAQDFDLRLVLNLTDDYYFRRVRPIMYHYIREKRYFQRNAAIALGNTRDSHFIDDLGIALNDPDPMVRGYSAWGLGNIGGEKAKLVLERALLSESDPFARNEIETAIPFA